MLSFALLLLIGSNGPAPQAWRIYVNPDGIRDTFHIAYPPEWSLERQGGSIVVTSPKGEVGVTISLHAGEGDTPDACAAAHLQDQGGSFASTPTRESLITMNWRAVSLEARGRQAGEEDTIRYSACLEKSSTPSHPLVSITSTARASAFESNRDVIVRISKSVRFRPAA